MDLLSDLGRFTPPVAAEDFGMDNLFDSNPNYDEASGPTRDDRYMLVDEFASEWDEEDEKDLWDRLLGYDEFDPLAYGETEKSAREDALELSALHVRIAPGYQPAWTPVKTAVRLFKREDFQPAMPQVVRIPIKVCVVINHTKKWVRITTAVNVSVRGKNLHHRH
ncbi:MAG: hypothetical protein Q8L52_00105 [bacterium]|nr:hypothetical protein [bacterium]